MAPIAAWMTPMRPSRNAPRSRYSRVKCAAGRQQQIGPPRAPPLCRERPPARLPVPDQFLDVIAQVAVRRVIQLLVRVPTSRRPCRPGCTALPP